MTSFDLKHQRNTLWQALQQALHLPTPPGDELAASLQALATMDRFWTYPGLGVMLRLQAYLAQGQFTLMRQLVDNCCHQLQSESYRMQTFRPFQTNLERLDRPMLHENRQLEAVPVAPLKPYFEVLIVHPCPADYEMLYRQQLASFKSLHDEFVYDIVLVDCAEDALTAVLANTDIQACVYLNHVPVSSVAASALYPQFSQPLLATAAPVQWHDVVEANLCRSMRAMRPELNHFLISELSPLEMSDAQRAQFDRVLFHLNPFQDLHAAILSGVRQRFSTPFFDALQAYSRQPKGVFHALPLSRGASVKGSPWIHDMLDFYGNNLFLAETSSTQGGLDSLLDPTGAILQAQRKAAETFGADSSYFVTNGTSTSNKIVMQANLQPGDLVLVSSDCHKSIPYSVMLTGAYPIFLETYPLVDYDLYGGIDLAQIKAVMLDLKAHGRLDQLKQITLTNSTFDGLIYHTEHFMMELLAIKPDVIFHWDEAWFAFSHFHPLYHSRTAMSAVKKIRQRIVDPAYWEFYAQWKTAFDANTDEAKWQQPLFPDPARVQLRVYATQSTHKTLSAFRQASMIHVADVGFDQGHFLEAFRIHTSTSPNYQIIASLDIARRQAALEGFHRVRECILLSMQLRQRIQDSAELAAYFSVLGDAQMIPAHFRSADAAATPHDLAGLSQSWGSSDFVIDPTRVTLDVSRTGMDGSSFRQLLMTRYDIQVNKTSRHTVLFLINIGATQASVDYLVQVLSEMAAKFAQEHQQQAALTLEPSLALPQRRYYHPAFMPFTDGAYHACDVRRAHYQGEVRRHVEFVPLSADTLAQVQAGRIWVSATFVTPYPPGYPVLVPGQIITPEILSFFAHIKVKEIHGFHFEHGFKVFDDEFLAQLGRTPVDAS
ncbi:MAG: arginine decarboxylase [Comamonadaceae bacterium]|nr:MAG: arginine decarboxylase [Comamonadaceae bacterium]